MTSLDYLAEFLFSIFFGKAGLKKSSSAFYSFIFNLAVESVDRTVTDWIIGYYVAVIRL